MKRLTLLTVPLLIAGAVIYYSPTWSGAGSEGEALPASAGTLPARARALQTTPDIVCIEVHYGDGSSARVPSGCTPVAPTPTATAATPPTSTSAPSLTPTPSATIPPANTPRPTVTPSATFSQTPSPTEIESTPTPEPGTPVPTTTPSFGACQGNVINAAGLTLRTDHSATANAIRVLPAGETVTITGFYVYSDAVNEWAHVRTQRGETGWLAAYFYTPPKRMLSWDAANEVCLPPDVTVEYESHPLPVFYGGFHTLAGEGAGDLLFPQYAGKFKLVKCLDNGFALCEQLKARDPNIVTIYRTYQNDCPPMWVYAPGSAWSWWMMIEGKLPRGSDYLEIMNECDPPFEYGDLWAQFMIEMARIVARERGVALLAYSAGPGHPDIPHWKSMVTYLRWTLGPEGIAPNGFRHGIALHSSAFAPESAPLPAGSWINHPWIADRERVMCETMRTTYDFSCEGVFIINSELGWSDGYQGSKDLFTCEQQGQMYRETIRRKKETGLVDGFALWNVGAIGGWNSVHPCLPWILQ